MRRVRASTGLLASALFALLPSSACSGAEPRTGSETNFLRSCEASCADGLACICGVCTRSCSTKGECSNLMSAAECVNVGERAVEAACPAAEAAAFCDVRCSGDTDCVDLGESFRCQAGYCRVPAEVADACPATPLPPGDHDRTLAFGDTTRSYLVHVPSGYTGTSPVPLVLDFHPLGGDSATAAATSGYHELGEEAGFIVAWPQGIDAAWNIGPCCTSSRDVDDVGFARAVVQALEAELCIDVNRVHAVGAVMGGGMAYHLACNAADVFAGVAPSGFDLLVESEQPCQPARPVTVVSFRGTADTLVPYEGGAQQPPGLDMTITLLGAVPTFQRWAELDQCTGSPGAEDANGCSSYSGCADGVGVTLCTTQGGGVNLGYPEIAYGMLSQHPTP